MSTTKTRSTYYQYLRSLPRNTVISSTVGSLSMSPTLKKGDVIQIRITPISQVKKNDIIVFYIPSMGLIVHRAIKLIKKSNFIRIVTKGDAYDHEDDWIVELEQFIGIVKNNLPSFR